MRPPWPGKKIDRRKFLISDPTSPFAKLLRERHSVRDFDDEHPVTLAELARFLDTTARVLSEWKSDASFEGGPEITYITRPHTPPRSHVWPLAETKTTVGAPDETMVTGRAPLLTGVNGAPYFFGVLIGVPDAGVASTTGTPPSQRPLHLTAWDAPGFAVYRSKHERQDLSFRESPLNELALTSGPVLHDLQ